MNLDFLLLFIVPFNNWEEKKERRHKMLDTKGVGWAYLEQLLCICKWVWIQMWTVHRCRLVDARYDDKSYIYEVVLPFSKEIQKSYFEKKKQLVLTVLKLCRNAESSDTHKFTVPSLVKIQYIQKIDCCIQRTWCQCLFECCTVCAVWGWPSTVNVLQSLSELSTTCTHSSKHSFAQFLHGAWLT